jgi:hypothetical protein
MCWENVLRASSTRCLAERLRDLGVEPCDMNNAFGVRIKTDDAGSPSSLPARAIDNDAEAWAKAVNPAPLVPTDGAS